MASIHPEVKQKIDLMVKNGTHEAKFAHVQHANYMVTKIHQKGLTAKVTPKLGHAVTLDSPAHITLLKHYHVQTNSNSAHRVLGKFI